MMRVSISILFLVATGALLPTTGSALHQRDLGKKTKGGKSVKEAKGSKSGKKSKSFSSSAFDEIISLLLNGKKCFPLFPFIDGLEQKCALQDGITVRPYTNLEETMDFCCEVDKQLETILEDCVPAPVNSTDCRSILPIAGVEVGEPLDLLCCSPSPDGQVLSILGAPVDILSIPDNSPDAEGPENAFDSDILTKFLVFDSEVSLLAELAAPTTVVQYTLTSANDSEERDPLSWSLLGSNDGATWVELDSQTDIDFPTRFATLGFEVANPGEYLFYELFTINNSGSITQFAELTFFVSTNEEK